MIYETAVVLRTDVTEDARKKVLDQVTSTITEMGGEIVMEDTWGTKTFAQPTKAGVASGHYTYFMFKAPNGEINTELERKFKISEEVLKFIFVKLGVEAELEEIKKNYKNPSSTSEAGRDLDKDRKAFSKRKSCWFSAKKTEPDWKDPNSYAWLVNEFGKISPARVTGLRPKYQRMATSAIKRGRCMGLISYMSNRTAY